MTSTKRYAASLLGKNLVATCLLGAALVGATMPAHAESLPETIKKKLEPRMPGGARIDSITKTPYGGLYEVRIGSDIFYTDEKAQYIFDGRVLNTKNFRDLTQARIDELTRVKFSDLPLDLAIKSVKGNGKRVIAVFEDPNCGYCKRFRQTLRDTDNITVYTFTYAILSDDSAVKAKNIWCSPEPAKALDEWMVNGKQAPEAAANCNAPIEKVRELGHRLRITGTPTIFFTDGNRIPGAIDAKGLEARLSSLNAGPVAK